MTDPYYFTGLALAGLELDRAAHRRRDTDWLHQQIQSPDSIWFPVHRGGNLMGEGEPGKVLRWSTETARPWLAEGAEAVFLGVAGDRSCWALDCTDAEEQRAMEQTPGSKFVDIRRLAASMPRDEAGMAAYARAMVHWHLTHRFCGACGSPTGHADAGHMRRCVNETCGRAQFPRTDPAVIVLVHGVVEGEEKCLLGHNRNFPPGLYSTLAGFVEPGESPEETVVREIQEESGIIVNRTRYVGAQPWPFPASLMIGFMAQAASTEIIVDPEELEDAQWFSRDELRERRERDIHLPLRHAIARHLIELWLAGETA